MLVINHPKHLSQNVEGSSSNCDSDTSCYGNSSQGAFSDFLRNAAIQLIVIHQEVRIIWDHRRPVPGKLSQFENTFDTPKK